MTGNSSEVFQESLGQRSLAMQIVCRRTHANCVPKNASRKKNKKLDRLLREAQHRRCCYGPKPADGGRDNRPLWVFRLPALSTRFPPSKGSMQAFFLCAAN